MRGGYIPGDRGCHTTRCVSCVRGYMPGCRVQTTGYRLQKTPTEKTAPKKRH